MMSKNGADTKMKKASPMETVREAKKASTSQGPVLSVTVLSGFLGAGKTTTLITVYSATNLL